MPTPSSSQHPRNRGLSLDRPTGRGDETASSDILQNKPPPILHIPPELLTDIITLCCQSPSYPCDQRTLVNITHVSRHFRNVAINFPLLWTTIDLCASRDWNAECLRRSKKAPLDIVACPDHNRRWCTGLATDRVEDQLCGLLKWNGWRVKSINMVQIGTPFEPSEMQLDALITHYQEVAMDTSEDSRPVAALRRITLVNCTIPWTTFRANLTHLSIVHNLSYTTPQEVLTTLASMQGLEYLQLKHLSFRDNLSSMPSANVHLPNIQSITLGSINYSHLRVLVSHIHYPPTANFTFSAAYPSQVDGPSKIFHDIPLSSCLRFKRLSVRHSVEFEQSSSIKIQSTGGEDPALIVKLVVYCNWGIYETLKTAIEDALTLPIGEIEELEMNGEGNVNVSSSDLLEFLGHCGRLQTLTIGPGLVGLFSQLLADELLGCVITSPSEPHSQNDKELVHTHDCSRLMNPCLANLQHLQASSCGNTWWKFEQYVEKYLAFREQIGNRLKTLEISTPYNASPSTIDRWSAMAESVIWTRWEGLSYDGLKYNSEDLWWNDDLWPLSDVGTDDAEDELMARTMLVTDNRQ